MTTTCRDKQRRKKLLDRQRREELLFGAATIFDVSGTAVVCFDVDSLFLADDAKAWRSDIEAIHFDSVSVVGDAMKQLKKCLNVRENH
jgi:hypothetical protein